jgi:drug/metabolite transporter (DMT)-like permease
MPLSFNTKVLINLLLVYFVWGSTYLGVRYAIEVLPPLMTSAIRFLIGGTLLLGFTFVRGHGLPTAKQWRSALWVGLLLSGIGNCVVSYAIGQVPTGLVALQVATLPGWVVGLDYVFFAKKRPSILTVIGLLVGLVGMYVLLDPFGGSSAMREIPLDVAALVFVGTIAWAWGSLQAPYLEMPANVFQTTAVQMLGGGLFAIVASLIFESQATASFVRMTPQTYAAIAYLILMGSFVGYSAYVWLIQHAPPTLTATYAYVNPVVAIFLGWLLINEKLSQRALVASAIVLVGVVLITWGRKR